jgi:SWIM zinc finger
MIFQNRQLDLSKICVDLAIKPNLKNERACALGGTLIDSVSSAIDPTVYFVSIAADANEKCRVILHDRFAACSCPDWQIHHRDGIYLNPPSSAWICPHGVAVLLSLGRSDTYLDFISLPPAPAVPTVEMDFGLDRRRFFAAFGRKYAYQWGMVGIDKDMAMEAYRLRFAVPSLSKLKQVDWAIAAAEVQAAVRSEMIMSNRADEIKTHLLGAKC